LVSIGFNLITWKVYWGKDYHYTNILTVLTKIIIYFQFPIAVKFSTLISL